MKIYFIVALLFMAMAAMAAPVEDEFEPLEHPETEGRSDRHRRVTCDLLSFKGQINDSACAANCITLGKAGGHCKDGVCICRKTTFKNLWDKRFG